MTKTLDVVESNASENEEIPQEQDLTFIYESPEAAASPYIPFAHTWMDGNA